MLFIHLFTDFMKHDHTKKKKIVILGRKEKVGVDPPPSPTTPASYREILSIGYKLSTLW